MVRGDLVVLAPDERQAERARLLMEEYCDVPMDLADATVVALAEALNVARTL